MGSTAVGDDDASQLFLSQPGYGHLPGIPTDARHIGRIEDEWQMAPSLHPQTQRPQEQTELSEQIQWNDDNAVHTLNKHHEQQQQTLGGSPETNPPSGPHHLNSICRGYPASQGRSWLPRTESPKAGENRCGTRHRPSTLAGSAAPRTEGRAPVTSKHSHLGILAK